jgi:hypothetical protein
MAKIKKFQCSNVKMFNMIMDKVLRRVTEGQGSELPKIMAYTGDIVIWEPKESTLEKKFQNTVIAG